MKEISAGGIVCKEEDNQLWVLLIKDKYQKVTIPKGKQEAGETLEETAIREIQEETGINGRIVQLVNKVYYTYTDHVRGEIDKEVTYYLVEAIGGQVDVQLEEINEVMWMKVNDAWKAQQENGYDNNHPIFEQAYSILKSTKAHLFS